jgi:hypothetical protein
VPLCPSAAQAAAEAHEHELLISTGYAGGGGGAAAAAAAHILLGPGAAILFPGNFIMEPAAADRSAAACQMNILLILQKSENKRSTNSRIQPAASRPCMLHSLDAPLEAY